MRIAIVTLPLHTNYGGILQAYALQTILEQMGHEVEHLQPKVIYPKLHPAWKMPLVYCKRFARKYFGGEKKLPIFMHPQKWIRKNTDKFIAKHINCRYLEEHEWNENLAKDYDAFIFGSDQVWRPIYARPIERYFGAFLDKSSAKRIAYAASFGTEYNEYSVEQQNNCSMLLKQFTGISVREDSAVDMCKSMFGVDTTHVLDPTLLLPKDDYIKLFDNKNNTTKSKGNLSVYILDNDKRIDKFIKEFSEKNNLKPFKTNSRVEEHDAPISERQQPPLEQWLRSFYDAEFIITDSFHACVFSIIFQKPFICIGNKDRGMARFESLLSMFGLSDRLIDISELNNHKISDIDWTKVNKILSNKRSEAHSFLEIHYNNN